MRSTEIDSFIVLVLIIGNAGMNKFRYIFEDRFAECANDAKADREELNKFFDTSVKGKIGDHSSVGADSSKQHIYNVCYDCNIPLWNEIYQRMVNIADRCNVKLNWDEIKHCLRFTFIWMPPRGNLVPHTANKFRALSAFNIPLRGKTEISFYEHLPEHKVGKKIETHEYFHPCFLNVNRFHGIVNNTDQERMILKTHLMIVPWEKLIESYTGNDKVNMFNFVVPWQTVNIKPNVKKTN